ncbi:NTP pyrophosphohydrolase [Streptomyces sp. NPDC059373]
MDTDTDTHSRPLVIVDAANTVGSVPDGWWRDRRGATERLRDALAPLAEQGLPDAPGVPDWATTPPLDLVLVVEGAARGVDPVPGVRIAAAPGSGDDLITDLAASAAGRPCLVITADRELRRRVAAHGAAAAGPKVVRP